MKIQESLSRRLHQTQPGLYARVLFLITIKTMSKSIAKINQLSNIDAAYIAGIIDGEGTITLSRKHKNENRQLVTSISNTEKDLLIHILDLVGAGKITAKKITSDKHSASFTYSIANRQALTLLDQITPYLRTYKRKRVQLVLKYYMSLTPRNGYYTEELKQRRNVFINEFFSILPNSH